MGTNGQFGSIRKLPSGRYQVRYFHLGRRTAADATFPTKSDARAFLSSVETDLKRGQLRRPRQRVGSRSRSTPPGGSSSDRCGHELARPTTRNSSIC